MSRFTRLAIAFVALAVLSTATPARAYVAPVVGEIIDVFRPPVTEYGPRNDGLEYATTPGGSVGAAQTGVVSFAGQVGGDLFVTIDHADGLRTTYGYLRSIGVAVGQSVQLGESIGTANESVQFDVRRGDQYIDPATLFPTHAYLVPLTSDQPTSHPILSLVTDVALAWLNSTSASSG